MSIVVCGYPRSGSTMFYNMLRSTVKGYTFFDKEVSALKLPNGKWISKYPSDSFYPDEIRELHADIGFVVTIRDPRAVLCSKHQTTGNLYKVSWDRVIFGTPRARWIRNRRGNPTPEPGEFQHHRGLVEWDAAVRRIPDALIVRYEDVVADCNREQDRIGAALGLEMTGKFSGFHRCEVPSGLTKQLNGLRPVDGSRIESWRSHPDRIRQQFTECPDLFEVVEHWGYEKDRSWFDAI